MSTKVVAILALAAKASSSSGTIFKGLGSVDLDVGLFTDADKTIDQLFDMIHPMSLGRSLV